MMIMRYPPSLVDELDPLYVWRLRFSWTATIPSDVRSGVVTAALERAYAAIFLLSTFSLFLMQ